MLSRVVAKNGSVDTHVISGGVLPRVSAVIRSERNLEIAHVSKGGAASSGLKKRKESSRVGER